MQSSQFKLVTVSVRPVTRIQLIVPADVPESVVIRTVRAQWNGTRFNDGGVRDDPASRHVVEATEPGPCDVEVVASGDLIPGDLGSGDLKAIRAFWIVAQANAEGEP